MTKAPDGIKTGGRNERQPADKERAQDPSSPAQDEDQRRPTDGQTDVRRKPMVRS